MSEEKLVPKLRFPSYSSEWHSYTLGEILTFYSTNSFSREKLNYDTGSVKNIHYGDIHTKFPSIVSVSDNKDIPFINNEIDLSKYSEDQYLQNGDLIIADASEDYEDIGKAIEVKNIDDEKVLAGLHTILARDNNNITVNGFKAYLFSTNSLKTKIKIIANGISVLGISKNSLSKLTVNVPSKNEQNDVVDFISLIDNKIELLEQKHQYYLDFKKFLMQQIFTQKLRFVDFNNSSWKDYKFKDLGTVKSGVGFSNKYQGHLDLDYNFYKVSDMNLKGNEKVMTRSNNTIDDNLLKDIGVKLIENPSIIFAKVGEAIFLNRKRIAKQPFLIDNNMMAFSPNENVDLEFMYYLATSINFGKYAQTGALPSYNASDIYSIKCKIPPIEEQKRIGKLLSLADNKIDFCSNQLNKTQEFKKGLLQQMFV